MWKRIEQACRTLGVAPEALIRVNEECGSRYVLAALAEASETATSLRDPLAWVVWRSRKLAADDLAARQREAKRRQAIDGASRRRTQESRSTAAAVASEQQAYARLSEAERLELKERVLKTMGPTLAAKLRDKHPDDSPLLQGLILGLKRKLSGST